jgi:hypothetical protein
MMMMKKDHHHAVPLPPPGVSGVSAFLNLLATALPKLKTPFLTAAAATLVASLAALQTNTGDHRDAYQCVQNCLRKILSLGTHREASRTEQGTKRVA